MRSSPSTAKEHVTSVGPTKTGTGAASPKARSKSVVCLIIWQDGLSTEGTANFGHGEAPVFVEVDDAGKAPVRVEQENSSSMVHRVVVSIARYLAVRHTKIRSSLSNLTGSSGQTSNPRVKMATYWPTRPAYRGRDQPR